MEVWSSICLSGGFSTRIVWSEGGRHWLSLFILRSCQVLHPQCQRAIKRSRCIWQIRERGRQRRSWTDLKEREINIDFHYPIENILSSLLLPWFCFSNSALFVCGPFSYSLAASTDPPHILCSFVCNKAMTMWSVIIKWQKSLGKGRHIETMTEIRGSDRQRQRGRGRMVSGCQWGYEELVGRFTDGYIKDRGTSNETRNGIDCRVGWPVREQKWEFFVTIEWIDRRRERIQSIAQLSGIAGP